MSQTINAPTSLRVLSATICYNFAVKSIAKDVLGFHRSEPTRRSQTLLEKCCLHGSSSVCSQALSDLRYLRVISWWRFLNLSLSFAAEKTFLIKSQTQICRRQSEWLHLDLATYLNWFTFTSTLWPPRASKASLNSPLRREPPQTD